MEILTLKSKVKLGCNMCDRCCVYRGDIKLTPINVCRISRFLKISNEEFLEKYTDKLEGRPLEIVLKTKGIKKECILYDNLIHGCGIHRVKPMQCTMFPLVPENLKRDYFIDSGECRIENTKEITVDRWLNGNNNNYKKNKNDCIRWIKFLEYVQPKIEMYNENQVEELNRIIFTNYNSKLKSMSTQMNYKMKKIIKIINDKKIANNKC